MIIVPRLALVRGLGDMRFAFIASDHELGVGDITFNFKKFVMFVFVACEARFAQPDVALGAPHELARWER